MRHQAFREFDRVAGGQVRPLRATETRELREILEMNTGRTGSLDQRIPCLGARRLPVFQFLQTSVIGKRTKTTLPPRA